MAFHALFVNGRLAGAGGVEAWGYDAVIEGLGDEEEGGDEAGGREGYADIKDIEPA